MKSKNTFLLLWSFFTILIFSGCESMNPIPPQLTNMTPLNPELIVPCSEKSCCLGEFEGQKARGDFIYKVTSVELKKIVRKALKHSQLFTTVSSDIFNSDYTITAKILGQPADGKMTMTAALYVKYQVRDNKTGKILFNKRIKSDYHVTTGEAPEGVKRWRLAREGAVRENVKQFVMEMSKIQI